MSNRSIAMTDTLYGYIIEHSLREDDLARRLREETMTMPQHNMQIAPEQGQLMALLARLTGARRAIEVGVFTGYSGLALARALRDTAGADAHLLACDVSEEWTDVACRFWEQAGVRDVVELVIAPALQTLDSRLARGQAGTYDLAFIDADKTSYDAYYERCLELLRPGGLVMIDNVLWDGDVADPSKTDETVCALRALNEKIHADERVDVSLVPIADGLTLAMKRTG
jgi:caffeoyl-CoA O-methyltransferase